MTGDSSPQSKRNRVEALLLNLGIPDAQDALTLALGVSPLLYNLDSGTFEAQRTPNRFPQGALAIGAGATVKISAAVDGTDGAGSLARDQTPSPNSFWRVLGGLIAPSAQCVIQAREEGGGAPFYYQRFSMVAGGGEVSPPFSIPGNGKRLSQGKGIEIWASAAVTVSFWFIVCEEPVSNPGA